MKKEKNYSYLSAPKSVISVFAVLNICLLLLVFCTSCGEKATHEGEVQAPIESSAASGKNYEDVVKQFKTAGFKEVSTREIPDLITGWLTKDGEVESVSINGDTEYSTNIWFPQDASVVVAYHTFPNKDEKAENDKNKGDMENSEEKKTEVESVEENNTEEKTIEEKTTELNDNEDPVEDIDESVTEEESGEGKSEPIIVDANNIDNIKVGDYISVTGPAHTLCTRGGKIKVGGNDSGLYSHCGMEIIVDDPNSSYSYYTIQAYKVNPGDYEETFYSHAPADFSTKPSTVGDYSYSGCRATIIGRVDEILISDESDHFYGLSLGDDSVVEYLELYY